jgi:hypothetical protein
MNYSYFARLRTFFLLPFAYAHRFVSFGVVTMVLALSACGSDTDQESLIEALTDVEGLEVDIDDGAFGYRVEDEDGVVVVGSGASLPSGFPDDVPIYEDAEIVGSFETAEELGVQLSASDSPEEVMRAYSKSLLAAGWQATGSMVMSELATTTFEKGPRVVSVTAMSVDGESSVITLATRPG